MGHSHNANTQHAPDINAANAAPLQLVNFSKFYEDMNSYGGAENQAKGDASQNVKYIFSIHRGRCFVSRNPEACRSSAKILRQKSGAEYPENCI